MARVVKATIKKDTSNIVGDFLTDIRKNPDLCYKKYVELLKVIKNINAKLDQLKIDLPFSTKTAAEYQKYRVQYAHDLIPKADVDAVKHLISTVMNPEDYMEECPFSDKYHAFKRSKTIIGLMESYKMMKSEDELLRNTKATSPLYTCIITKTFCPFSFLPSFDIVQLRDDKVDGIIRAIYLDFEAYYKELISPDVDIDKIKDIIFSAVDHMGTQVDRIDDTIKFIKSKTVVLTNVIEESFEDYLASEQNPAIIMSKFLGKIKEEADNSRSVSVKSGIIRIIRFFNSRFAGMPQTNPKVAGIINMINKITADMSEEDNPEEINITEADLNTKKNGKSRK